jgi:hypothetical protein
MKYIVLSLVFMLSGCSTIVGLIPSFSDVNQSRAIIDVRASVDSVDCTKPQLAQATIIAGQLRWFELYSESRGRRDQDVIRVIKPIQETVADWQKRDADGQASQGYCKLKKQILQSQTARAASVVLGRF